MPKWLVLSMVVVACIAATASGAAPRDRDHDRLPDRWERKHHLSTAKPSAKRDPDSDGLNNRRELRLRTHPRRRDTDRDRLRDGAEVRRFHTNPRKPDTDGDGFRDRCELRKGTNPRNRRSRPRRRCSDSPQGPPRNVAPPPPGGGPPPAPPHGGFPNALNTGVPPGTTLEPYNGNLTVDTPGTVISNRLINGCVTVNAANVTIRSSKVVCSGPSAIWSGSTGLLVEDTEVDCNNAVSRTAITPQGYTARRVNAHSCENIFWAERNVLIEDSYIHDPIDYDPVLDPHTDSIQMPGGATNITIDHNTVYGNYVNQSSFGNAAIAGASSGMSDITINNNLLAGGGYTVYCPEGVGTNYRITNNRFSRVLVSTVGGFGPWIYCRDEPVVSGNVYDES